LSDAGGSPTSVARFFVILLGIVERFFDTVAWTGVALDRSLDDRRALGAL
jgi:hypothetical protein